MRLPTHSWPFLTLPFTLALLGLSIPLAAQEKPPAPVVAPAPVVVVPAPVVAPAPVVPPVHVSISQQSGFQSGGLNTNVTSGGIDSVLNQNILNSGVTTGQGDGPGEQAIRVSSGAEKWLLFSTFNYGNLDVEGNAGVQVQSYAGAVGALYRLCEGFRVGASVGRVYSTGSFANEAGRLKSDGTVLTAYGIANFGDTFVDLIYAATLQNNDFSREVPGSRAIGSADSVTHAISSTLGHNMRFGRLVTGPRIGLDFTHFNMDSYTETGAGLLFNAAEQRANSLIARLDWFTSYDIQVGAGTLTPYCLVGWHRETFGGQPTLATTPVGGGASPIVNAGPDRIRHYLVASAGITWNIGNDWKVNAGYVGQLFGGAYQVHTASAMIAYSF